MPIIAPPPDTVYQEEPTSSEATSGSKLKEWERYRRICIYMNVNNWICILCGSVVFGRCKKCPYCWGRCNYRISLRPADFKLRRTNEYK